MAGFFSKVQQGLNKGTQVISVKSSTMMETNKLKGEISGLKKEKGEIFTAMGTQLYTMKQEGYVDLSQLDAQFERLTAIDATIVEKENAIEEVLRKQEETLQNIEAHKTQESAKITCSCGAVINADTKFCPKCGTKVEKEEIVVEEAIVQDVPQTIICECGAELAPGTVFCAQCGKKVG